MKKAFLVVAAAVQTCIAAAQYNNVTYSTSSNAKLVQIDQYDDFSVFHFTYTSAGTEELYADMEMLISISGTSQKYRLKGAENLPTNEETHATARFNKAGEQLNFTLMFEKLPLDKPFSIIAKKGESGCNILNFTDVKVNMNSQTEKIDSEKFFASNRVMTHGKCIEDGIEYSFAECGGLNVAVTSVYVKSEWISNVQRIFLNIENKTGKSVDFKVANIKTIGYDKDDKPIDLKVYTCKEFMKQLKSGDFWSKAYAYSSLVGAVSSIGSRTTLATSQLATSSAYVVMSELESHSTGKEYRKVAEEYYAKDCTVANKSEYTCYYNIKNTKKLKSCLITVEINGKVFECKIPISHK